MKAGMMGLMMADVKDLRKVDRWVETRVLQRAASKADRWADCWVLLLVVQTAEMLADTKAPKSADQRADSSVSS